MNDKYLIYLNEKNIYDNLLDVIKDEEIKKINFEKLFKIKDEKVNNDVEIDITENKYNSITIQKFMQQISNISNDEKKNYLLYKLIRSDGITINNYIFSKNIVQK